MLTYRVTKMYFAEFESICGTGETVKKAVADFHEAYAAYNDGDTAAITDINIYEVNRRAKVEINYEIIN